MYGVTCASSGKNDTESIIREMSRRRTKIKAPGVSFCVQRDRIHTKAKRGFEKAVRFRSGRRLHRRYVLSLRLSFSQSVSQAGRQASDSMSKYYIYDERVEDKLSLRSFGFSSLSLSNLVVHSTCFLSGVREFLDEESASLSPFPESGSNRATRISPEMVRTLSAAS